MASPIFVRVGDGGGPIRFRTVEMQEGDHAGERFAMVAIGPLEIAVDEYGEIAAERCQAIAEAFHGAALELLRGPGLNAARALAATAGDARTVAREARQALDARAHAGDGEGALRELSGGEARQALETAANAAARRLNHDDGGEGLPNP
jgi:hypothetical protein